MMQRLNHLLFAILLLSLAVQPAFTQQTLPALKTGDYKIWQALSGYQIADDGRWAAYQIRLNEGDDTLYIKHLSSDKQYAFALASNPKFTSNSKWVAFRIGFSRDPDKAFLGCSSGRPPHQYDQYVQFYLLEYRYARPANF